MPKQRCKSCKHLKVALDRNGRRVVRKHYTYECDAPIPQVTLPESVTRSWGFIWPPDKQRMDGESGEHCPAYEVYIAKGPGWPQAHLPNSKERER